MPEKIDNKRLQNEEIPQAASEWTFQKYIRSIGHFKWWVIGFSLLGAVTGFLGFKFVLNPMRKTLSATYTYDLAGTYTDSDTIRFIDGTLFNPYDLTSKANLEKVKNNNEKFANIDIDRIAKEGAITITKNVTYYNENDSSSANINYSIQAKAKYFGSDDLGKDFIYDLINLAQGLSTEAINSYQANSSFTENFASMNFERQINQLSAQYESIDNLYLTLENKFGATASGNSNEEKIYELYNKYVSSYYISAVSTFSDVLKGQKDSNKYYNYVIGQEDVAISDIHALSQSYIETIKDNNKNIAIYEERLNDLLNSKAIIDSNVNISAQISQYDNLITNLKLNNKEIDKELNNNGYFENGFGDYVFDALNPDTTIYKLTQKDPSWVQDNLAFAESVKVYKASLEIDRNNISSICQFCFSKYQNKVNIQNSGYVVLSNSINNLIGGAAGLILGFFATSFITAAVYIYKGNKKEA